MRTNHRILLLLATTAFAATLWAGCTVGFETEQSGVFICESNDDCLEGFECSEGGEDEGTCVQIVVGQEEAPPCDQDGNPENDIDLDNDGYGTGTLRTNCPPNQRALDCDDENPDVNPGVTEKCNGVDDDCNGETEQVDYQCEPGDSCGTSPVGLDFNFTCQSGTCTLRPVIQPEGVCREIFITCNPDTNTFTYVDPRDDTQYNYTEGPVLECSN